MIHDLYIIGAIHSLTRHDIQQIDQSVNFPVPLDYKDFIGRYGFGEINELLMITQPDENYIRNNFTDYMFLWDWQDETEQKALEGLAIGATIDGDILVVIDEPDAPFLILPRHSEHPLPFPDFSAVVNYYITKYHLGNDLYFDTYNNSERKYINLGSDGKTKELMHFIHQQFLARYPVDQGFNLLHQPKYVLQTIGGWLYFDLLSGVSIRIKYQLQFKSKVIEIMRFIREATNRYRREQGL